MAGGEGDDGSAYRVPSSVVNGQSFSEEIHNASTLQTMHSKSWKKHLVLDWERLNAQIQDKRRELEQLRSRIQRVAQTDQRFNALVSALLELVDS